MPHRHARLVGCLAILCLAFQPLYAGWEIQDLGALEEGWVSSAQGLSANGEVVGYSYAPPPEPGHFPGPAHAFYWDAESGMMAMHASGPWQETRAWDINDTGWAACDVNDRFGIWDRLSDYVFQQQEGQAWAINNQDQMVGYVRLDPPLLWYAFLWTWGNTINLGTLGGDAGQAEGINEAGQVVGRAETHDSNTYHAFLITPDNGVWYRDQNFDGANDLMLDLGTLPGDTFSTAVDVNEDGEVLGRSGSRAFIYRDGSMTDLGSLGGTNMFPHAINDAAQAVGYGYDAEQDHRAFIWEAGVLYDLNDLVPPSSDWTLWWARDINNATQIAASGRGSDDEPSHALLLSRVFTRPPDEVSAPAAQHALVFADGTALRWEPTFLNESATFNLYRGDVVDLPRDYGDCIQSGIPSAEARDEDQPGPGTAWFYLVTGENDFGDGPPGQDSEGIARVVSAGCS